MTDNDSNSALRCIIHRLTLKLNQRAHHGGYPPTAGRYPKSITVRKTPFVHAPDEQNHAAQMDSSRCLWIQSAYDESTITRFAHQSVFGGIRMSRSRFQGLVTLILVIPALAATAREDETTDNALSPEEKASGWILLFDGKDLAGWQTSSKKLSKVPVENGSINPHGCGGYMMIHQEAWADFLLSLDFRISRGCNSGVFIRTYPLTPRPGKDVGFNGIEVAIDDTTSAGYYDTGAIYDLVKPSTNAM